MSQTYMSVLESLGVDVFGFSIVFFVLIALSFVIRLISKVITGIQEKDHAKALPEVQSDILQIDQGVQYSDGELKLIDVDEKTAALIMAIVSDDAGIPLSQLRFQSIRLMK